MILQNEEEIVPGMSVKVILTDDWLNQTIYDAQKMIKEFSDVSFPAKADREKYLILKHKNDDFYIFVADNRTLSFTRRLRCALELGKRMSIHLPEYDEGDLIEMAGRAINNTYMIAIENIIREAK